MKIQGYFEKVWEQQKEGSSWVNIYGDFQVKGERDVIRVRIPRSKDWCLENGIKTGAAGEIQLSCGYNDRGYYEQNVWGFKTAEQLAREAAERAERHAVAEKAAEVEQKAQEAVKQAKEEGEGTDLPF